MLFCHGKGDRDQEVNNNEMLEKNADPANETERNAKKKRSYCLSLAVSCSPLLPRFPVVGEKSYIYERHEKLAGDGDFYFLHA